LEGGRERERERDYKSEFAVSGADVREGGILANSKNRVIARSAAAVGSSFSLHILTRTVGAPAPEN